MHLRNGEVLKGRLEAAGGDGISLVSRNGTAARVGRSEIARVTRRSRGRGAMWGGILGLGIAAPVGAWAGPYITDWGNPPVGVRLRHGAGWELFFGGSGAGAGALAGTQRTVYLATDPPAARSPVSRSAGRIRVFRQEGISMMPGMKPAAAVRTAGPADERAMIATLALAFGSDPAARWVYSDPQEYLAHFPVFARVFGGRAFGHGSAYTVDGYAGAALWLPPGVQPDEEELWDLLGRTVPERIREDAFGVFEQMGNYRPNEPHWYLPLMGVDAPFQNQGYGSAMLRRALAVCDRDSLPAYLESSNARNVTLYERHGFRVIGTIQAGSSPQIYPMLRPPAVGQ